MSQYSWSWATEEQRQFFVQIEPHFRSAQCVGDTADFYSALREQWFLRWPIIPELIAQGILPPDASREDYDLTEHQARIVSTEEDEKFKVCPTFTTV